MKISVVIPTLNARSFLEATLASIHGQAGCEFESIVVDGGSGDGTRELLRGYGPRLAWWVSEPDRGAYDAVNKGFAAATGDILAWLNASDLYTPWTLATVASVFSAHPEVRWLTSLRPVSVDERGQFISMPLLTGFNRQCLVQGRMGLPMSPSTIQQESTFWRRELWDAAGSRVPPGFHWAGDLALWARFFEHAPLYGLNVPLAAFRQHRGQRSRAALYGTEAVEVIREARRRPPVPHQFAYGFIQPRITGPGGVVQWERHLVQGGPDEDLLIKMEGREQELVAKEAEIRRLASALGETHAIAEERDRELAAKEAEINRLALALGETRTALAESLAQLAATRTELDQAEDFNSTKSRGKSGPSPRAVRGVRKLARWCQGFRQAPRLPEQTRAAFEIEPPLPWPPELNQATPEMESPSPRLPAFPEAAPPRPTSAVSQGDEPVPLATSSGEGSREQRTQGRRGDTGSRRRIWVAHHLQTDNIGDYACDPFLYLEPPNALEVEIRSVSLTGPELTAIEDEIVVLGGGGLLNPWCRDAVMLPLLAAGNSLVAWGIGHHVDNRFTDARGRRWERAPVASLADYGVDYSLLRHFILVGVRDYGAPWPYLPCATCLHPGFDRVPPAPSHPVVVYEHADLAPVPIEDFPKRNNRGREEMAAVLGFLATGETVITNTFHGAYWALLLGRRVLIYEPWCSKFFTFPTPLTWAGASDWRAKLPLAADLPGYLRECRELNHAFARRFWDEVAAAS